MKKTAPMISELTDVVVSRLRAGRLVPIVLPGDHEIVYAAPDKVPPDALVIPVERGIRHAESIGEKGDGTWN